MSAARQAFSARSLARLALALIAMACLAGGLAESIRGMTTAILFPAAALGIFLGWACALSPLKSRQAWTSIAMAGPLVIFARAARLGGALAALLKSTPAALRQLAAWAAEKTPPDLSALRSALAEVSARAGTASSHLWLWLEGLLEGRAVDDPLVRELLWSILILLIAAWAAWALGKHKQAFLALAPATALLAYALDYSGANAFVLQVELCVLLLMMGVTEGQTRLERSQQAYLAAQRKASAEATQATIALCMGLAIAAGLTPSISVRAITRYLQETSRERKNQEMAEALGLQVLPGPPSEFAQYTSAGLPRQHLVGAGPAPSREVVFYAKTGDLPRMPAAIVGEPAPRYYWRDMTYDVYTGQGWASTLTESDTYGANQRLFETIPSNYRLIHVEVQRASGADARLYWSGTLLSVDQPYDAAWRARPGSSPQGNDPFKGADLVGALGKEDPYQVDSLLAATSIERLRASPPTYPDWIRERYLALPPTVPERVLTLAHELTAGRSSPYDQAEAIESYLRTFPYTLDVPLPPPGRDVADFFLFDEKKGYCDYYATAMVVLARAAGLPARLVSGYASGVYDAPEARYIVRQSDAHSWVEVYFSEVGWVEFEPTAGRPRIEHPAQSGATTIPATPDGPEAETGLLVRFAERFSAIRGRLPLLAAGLLAILVGYGVASEIRWRICSRDVTARIYQHIFHLGRKLVRGRPAAETPLEFARALTDKLREIASSSRLGWMVAPSEGELAILTDMYVRSVYGPPPHGRAENAAALRAWRWLYWRLLLAGLLRSGKSGLA